jgi:hypothetical protein
VRTTSDAVNAHVLLAVIPQMAQVEASEHDRTMHEYRFTDSEVDWERPQREVRARADSVGVPVLDLLPEFRAMSQTDQLYLRLDEHFTLSGHRLTAQRLADQVVSAGWLRRTN